MTDRNPHNTFQERFQGPRWGNTGAAPLAVFCGEACWLDVFGLLFGLFFWDLTMNASGEDG
jgi:hypothetical protein